MGLSFTIPPIPATPAVANLPLASTALPPSIEKDVAMLPKTMLVAAQIGNSALNPTSFFGQLLTHRYSITRFILPTEPQKLDFDQKKRREFIRGVIVTKTDTSNDTSDKPKDQ